MDSKEIQPNLAWLHNVTGGLLNEDIMPRLAGMPQVTELRKKGGNNKEQHMLKIFELAWMLQQDEGAEEGDEVSTRPQALPLSFGTQEVIDRVTTVSHMY
jgi:hypothetical protein